MSDKLRHILWILFARNYTAPCCADHENDCGCNGESIADRVERVLKGGK